MSTYFGTTGNDVWTIQWAAIITIDGLGGTDTLNLGTSKRTDYKIMQAEDGAILVESVSRASSPFKGTLYNMEKLVFDSGRDVMLLTSGTGLNKIEGNGVSTLIQGTDAADHLLGTVLDERLVGGLGNDLIDGGAGVDTAVYSMNAEDYGLSWSKGTGWKVSFEGPVIAISPPPPTEGVDTLLNIERLAFADRVVRLDTANPGDYVGLSDSLYHFFIVAFGAAPGVTYMDQLAEATRAGMSLQAIVDVFITKPQFTDVYGLELSAQAFAQKLVSNVVKGSASEAVRTQAVKDVQEAMELAGWSRGQVIYTVFGNLAQKPVTDVEWGKTAQMFQNQVMVAKAYTEVLHQSTTDLATLRSVLEEVGYSEAVTGTEQAVEIALIGLMGNG